MIQFSSQVHLSLLQTSCLNNSPQDYHCVQPLDYLNNTMFLTTCHCKQLLNYFPQDHHCVQPLDYKLYNQSVQCFSQSFPQDHHCVQPRPDSGCLRRVFHSSLPAHRRPCKVCHLSLCIWITVALLEHQILLLYSLSLIQKPFCVSVSPDWWLQRQKGLKLVRLTGELGSVAQFHIAKLAHTQSKMKCFDLHRIMISSTRIFCHIFNPPLCRLTEGCSFRRKQH